MEKYELRKVIRINRGDEIVRKKIQKNPSCAITREIIFKKKKEIVLLKVFVLIKIVNILFITARKF